LIQPPQLTQISGLKVQFSVQEAKELDQKDILCGTHAAPDYF
jgi:hypothetical protein